MKITITIEIVGNPFARDIWSVNPVGWSRRQAKRAAKEIGAAERHKIPQIRYLREKAKENGFDLGLKDSKETIDRLYSLGFLEKVSHYG